ncbi:MAG: cadherin domain-containing protein, partial [Bosea sp. (in: a-proteobacteria)]
MPEPTDRQQVAQEANRLPAALAASGAGVMALAAADITTIDRPAAGQTRVIDVAGAKHVKFNFLQADFTVQVLDVDAVLTFADGGKLVMPAFVMQIITADPPRLHFGNVQVDPQAILASAGDIRMSEQLPQLARSENAQVATKPEDQPKPQVVQMPSAQQFANTPSPSASARQSNIVGVGDGEALQDSNGRYARRVNVDEAQSSSLKGEGSLTERTNAIPVETPTPDPVEPDPVEPEPEPEPEPPAVEPNVAPEITSQSGQRLASLQQDENTASITQVTATDADVGSQLIFAIVGGRDSTRFSINSVDGQLYFIAAPDHENPLSAQANNDYEVIVQVSDGRDVDQQTLNIRVANVNEAPHDVTITSSIVTENAINGTLVGRASGVDPDAGAVLSYSFAPGGDAGGRFAINSATGDITVLRGDLIDYEASQNQLVIVRVTDQAGLSFDQSIVLVITDANDPPVITSNGGGSSAAIAVSENLTAVTIVTATDTDIGSVLTYSIVGGADAAQFTINAATGSLHFVAGRDFEIPLDANGDNIYQVIVQASDGLGGIDTQTLSVSVVNGNEIPDTLTLTNSSIAENSSNGSSVGFAVGTDPDPGAVLRYSLIPGGDAGGRFVINSVTGEVTVADGTRLDFETNPSHVVIVRVTDQGGLSLDRAFTINVTNVNEAPVITANGGGPTATLSVIEGIANFATITASDPEGTPVSFSISGGADAALFTINAVTGALSFIAAPNFEMPTDADGDNVYDIIVQVSDGGLTDTQALSITVTNQNEAPVITSNGGGTSVSISINESQTAITTVTAIDPDPLTTLTYAIVGGADGSRFTINATTGVLTLIAPPDYETPTDADGNNIYDVIVQASDGTLVDTQLISVSVINQNDPPVIVSNGGGATGTGSVAENSSIATTIVATDADIGAVLTYTILGGADAARFTINSTTGVLSFIAPPNFEAPTDADGNNQYEVTVQVFDGVGGVDTQALTITVSNQNEAPVITSNGGGTTASIGLLESVVNVTTVTATDPDAATTLIYTIVGGADAAKFAINTATGQLNFIAAPDYDVPGDADGNNVYDVRVQASDGALTAFQDIAVTVTNINEAPTITSLGGGATGSVSTGENGTVVSTVVATDADAGTTLTYTIIGGADNALFTINPTTGVLTFVSARNFEAPTDTGGDNVYDVIVQVSDGLGGLDSQAIAVTVTNQNDPPVITSNGGGPTASISVAENTTAITTVISTDPDFGATRSFSIAGGVDASRFTINATTGVLTFTAARNFENPLDTGGNNIYDVIVQVSDGLGGTATQAIAVTVTNVNEAPVITSNGGGPTASVSVSENQTGVTTVTSTDPDASPSRIFSIIGGADASKFTIDVATGVLTFIAAPNFEAPTDVGADNVYNVNIQVSDGLGGIDTQTIAVTVTNQNEAPTITSNGGGPTASITIAENGTAVTTVTATDPDTPSTLTYSLVGGADQALFTINVTTGVLTFIGAPNFDAPTDAGGNNVYDVQVRVSDGALTSTQSIAVTVTNVNEAPVISSNGGGPTASINYMENVGAAAVTTVVAADQDAATTLTYSIVGGADSGKFTINATTGVLTFVTNPDFETPTDSGGDNTYDVIVQVSDGTLLDTQAIAITVVNDNDAPVITSNLGGPTAAITIAENGTAVTTVTATDIDAGATQTYSIAGGADSALFSINATTGVLTFIGAPNFEAPGDTGANNIYDVIVQVSDGLGGIDTQAIAITVTNENEAPTITSNGGGPTANINFGENGLAITTVTATDVDALATQTYSIVGGVDAAMFTINATTGVLSFIAPPNFEAPGDANGDNIYGVQVRVSDGLGGFDDQSILVTVINQNEAPVITSNLGGPTAAITIAENGTAVTTVTATDIDAGATQTYSISGGADAALFAINATTGVLTFIGGPNFESPLDAGANNVYDVIVQVSDGLGGTDTQAIAVTITDVNDRTPVITSNGGGNSAAISIDENGTAVTTVTATDADTVGTISYSISGGADAALFAINATTGVLTFIGAPNFEAPTDSGGNNVYDVVVRAFDGV